MMPTDDDNEDTFRILVATDNHIGYLEKDGLRGNDTFRSFEEVLQLANNKNVDFILLAGDIFHESRPSLKSTHEVMRLLRFYCLGSKPVQFELLSNPQTTFTNTSRHTPNYLDSNINVNVPVFTIHGNHDDLSGPGGLCAADILHTSGLVNLFGKSLSVEQINVNPILLRKGKTRLALYGLGAVREERLHRLFLNSCVTFFRPSEDEGDWFSLCAVHQNRARHGPTSYLPEQFLPDFMDLIIWGHEHECRIEPEWNSTKNFYVVQPGSSVATALCEGEARDKAVALLEVRGKEFKVTRLPLRTVRPFLFADLVLQEHKPKLDPNAFDIAKQIEYICDELIESEISKATSATLVKVSQPSENLNDSAVSELQSTNHSASVSKRLIPPPEPLIRLRIDLSGGFESFSVLRFGQKYVGRVANPKDLVTFNRNRERLATAQADRMDKFNMSTDANLDGSEYTTENKVKVGMDSAEVEALIRQYLSQMVHGKNKSTLANELPFGLSLFTTFELENSLRRFVDRGMSDAIQSVCGSVLDKTLRHLRMRKVPEERVVADVMSFCSTRHTKSMQSKDTDNEDDLYQQPSDTTPDQPTSNTAITKCPQLDWSLDDDDVELTPKTELQRNTKTVRNCSKASVSRTGNHSIRRHLISQSQSDNEAEDLADLIEDDDDDDWNNSSTVCTRKRKPAIVASAKFQTGGRCARASRRKTKPTRPDSPDLDTTTQLDTGVKRRKLR